MKTIGNYNKGRVGKEWRNEGRQASKHERTKESVVFFH